MSAEELAAEIFARAMGDRIVLTGLATTHSLSCGTSGELEELARAAINASTIFWEVLRAKRPTALPRPAPTGVFPECTTIRSAKP